MTDQPFQLSDAAIEAALARRAPGHADAALLADIVATAATTRQARGWTVPVLGRPRPVWAVVAAAALLVAGLLAVGIGSGQPPSPTPAPSVLGVVPPSAAGPSEALPSASAETCATETTQVLVGSAMPPATTGLTTIPAGLLDIGAYLTRTPDGSSNTPTDVWIARSGVSKRIASIVGPDFNIASIDDVSADGQLVLLQIGVIHMTQPGPECSDLYAVRTDGSSVTRVTHYGPNQNAFGGSFSADGRNVAFTYSELNASDAIGVVDVAGLGTPRLSLCDGGPTTGLQVRWAPDDDRLAAFCGTSVQLQFPGSVGSIPVSIGSEHFVGFDWQSPTSIVVVSAVDGATFNAPYQLRTLTMPGTGLAGLDGTFSAPLVVESSFGYTGDPFTTSPDGRTLALTATPLDNLQDFYGYAIDAATGRTQLVDVNAVGPIGWSRDSGSVIYPARNTTDSLALIVTTLSSDRKRPVAVLPPGYETGLWRGA